MSSSSSSSTSAIDFEDEVNNEPPPVRTPQIGSSDIRMPLEGVETQIPVFDEPIVSPVSATEESVSETSNESAADINSDSSRHENNVDEDGNCDDDADMDEESLLDLAREWILTQLGRNCSNAVADDFFQLAWEKAHIFFRLRDQNIGRQNLLPELRRKVIKEKLPPIKMDFLLKDIKESEEAEVEVVKYEFNHLHFPRNKFPPDKFELLSQVTRVKVNNT